VSAILALAAKDLRLLVRDRMDLFFTLVFPLFVAVFFGSIFSGGGDGEARGMPVAIVDADRSPSSKAFIDDLGRDGEFAIRVADDPAAASDLVRRGSAAAAVLIPQGFGEASEAMFRGESIRLEVTVDPSRRAEAGMIQGILTKHAFRQMFGSFSEPGKMQAQARKSLERLRADAGVDPSVRRVLEPFLVSLDTFSHEMPAALEVAGDGGDPSRARGGWEPIAIDLKPLQTRQAHAAADKPPSAYAVSFPQAVIWGVLGAAMSFGVSLSNERGSGTLMRLFVSPMTRPQVLAGKAVACFITIVAVCVLIMAMGAAAFGVRPVNVPLLALAILCIAFAFVGVMMVLAVIGKSAGGAGGLGRAVMLVLAMVGGGSIPLQFMPGWMRTASGVSPFKWAVQALDGAVWRNLTLQEMALPLSVLIVVGVVGFLVGSRLFTRAAA
jgi:ABC-2 type transport system permease protein